MNTHTYLLDAATCHTLATAYAHRHQGIALLDSAGTIRYLNAAWKTLLGARDADVFRLGNHYLEAMRLVSEPECDSYLAGIRQGLQLVAQGEREHVLLHYPHNRAGFWRWFHIHMSIYPLPSQWGVLVEQRDSTRTLSGQAASQERVVGEECTYN